MKKVSYVVLSFGRQDLTVKCLTTFRKFHPDDDLVLADNGGPNLENTVAIAAMFGAKLVVNPANDSLSKLMNMGIEVTDGDFVCLATNGVEFTTRLTEQFIRDFERDEKTAVVGGLLFYPDGRIQHGGGRRFWNSQAMGHYGQHRFLHQVKLCTIPSYRLYVTGATAAVRKSFWKEHPYDETLKMSCEDTDMCFKAWQSGMNVYYDPEITSIHNEGSTRGRTEKEKKQNAPVIYEREKKTLEIFMARYSHYDCRKIEESMNDLNEKLHPDLPKAFVRHGAIGDVMRTLEVYDKIVEKNGPCVVITGVPEVFRDRPVVELTDCEEEFAVSRIINLDMTQEEDRTKPVLEMYAKAAGVEMDTTMKPVKLKTTGHDKFMLRKELVNFNWANRYVVFHMGVGFPGKMIGNHIWEELLGRFRNAGYYVICVGSGNDMSGTGQGVFNLVGKTTLHTLRELLYGAKLFIGVDSGPLHVADGVCPALGLFTVCDPKNLVSDRVTAIETTAECKGCITRQGLVSGYRCEYPVGDSRMFMCSNGFNANQLFLTGMNLMDNGK
jgi:GT2 family glycosyltransferase